MATVTGIKAAHSGFWPELCEQTRLLASDEPILSSYYFTHVLSHGDFEAALAFHIAAMLDSMTVSGQLLNEVFGEIVASDASLVHAAISDIKAYYQRDPACDNYCRPFLFFKGYMAIQAHRFAHCLWQRGRRSLALYIQHRVSSLFDVDIHPAASLGEGIMVDHATGLVIGETASVGDNVSLMHGVTLGGTGCETGQRHPTIGEGVLVSAGAKILGNIQVGAGAKVGAGSVVLETVPAHVTVVGVPAKIVGTPKEQQPALHMNQNIDD